MIEITSVAKITKDGKGLVVEGHSDIECKKGLIAAEMSGVLNELWRADRDAFSEAMDMFMEYGAYEK